MTQGVETVVGAAVDALVDSAKMVPLLFVIYFLIELVEFRWGSSMGRIVAKAKGAGPLVGSALGIIPQCGFSVMGTALYTQRLLTIGTLMSIYIATSDEAIPIILAQPDAAPILVPILAIKFVVAIIIGYLIDFAFRRRDRAVKSHIDAYEEGHDEVGHHHEGAFEEKGCCGYSPTSPEKKLTAHELLFHPLVHTIKIFLFIFAVSFLLALLFAFVGQETIASALGANAELQPVLAALIGLIPNCAASVAITELYLSGTITFPAVISGLCASAGLGILVLFKEGEHREAALVTVGLFAISVAVGSLIGIFV